MNRDRVRGRHKGGVTILNTHFMMNTDFRELRNRYFPSYMCQDFGLGGSSSYGYQRSLLSSDEMVMETHLTFV
eukprot:bmy_07060T0